MWVSFSEEMAPKLDLEGRSRSLPVDEKANIPGRTNSMQHGADGNKA